MKAIDILRERCKSKMLEASKGNDNELIDMLDQIDTFLINDRCFLRINRISALYILELLGFSDEEADLMYDELISYENIKGDFVIRKD